MVWKIQGTHISCAKNVIQWWAIIWCRISGLATSISCCLSLHPLQMTCRSLSSRISRDFKIWIFRFVSHVNDVIPQHVGHVCSVEPCLGQPLVGEREAFAVGELLEQGQSFCNAHLTVQAKQFRNIVTTLSIIWVCTLMVVEEYDS